MKHTILFLAAISFTSCAGAPLSSEERLVRILRKSDPPANCQEIGKVHSPGLGAWSEDGREENLKRAAYKEGGDTVTYDRIDENNTIYGTVFKCRSDT